MTRTEKRGRMQLMQVDCEVTYDGRGHTTLPRGHRLVIVKDDGSVAIHQDKGIRPLNYMSKSTELRQYQGDDGHEHFVASSNREMIDIRIYETLFETFLDFPDEAELQRQGTEKQLQAWLANEDNFHATIGDEMEFVTREFVTGKGAVDLLGIDQSDGQIALIEVKREAKRNDPFQVVRYRTAILERRQAAIDAGEDAFKTTATKDAVEVSVASCENPHLILVAPRFKRGVASECERRGVIGLQIGDEWQETADFSITGTHKDEVVGMESCDEAKAPAEEDQPGTQTRLF
jgi:RecB family endonuclease NucS